MLIILSLNMKFASFVYSGYIVEKCEEGSTTWGKVPGIVNGTSHVVKDLEPGKKYKFRVKAENLYGVGDPVETDRAILAKNPYGKSRELALLTIGIIVFRITTCFVIA